MTLRATIRRVAAAPLALALLPATLTLLERPARAQQGESDWEYIDPQNRIAWPPSLGSQTFGRSVAGNYTQPGVGSVAVMYGSMVALMFEPGLHGTVVDTGYAANDVATLVGGGAGGRDALVLVSSSAPQIVTYDPSDGGFDAATISGAGSTWDGAKLVRSADLDQGGTQDVIGVASDLRTILLLNGNGSGGFSAGTGFTVNNDILDLGLLDWNGSGAFELALLTTWGLEVFSSSGTLLASTRTYQTGASMAVLSFPGPNATDRVAVVTRPSSGDNQFLLVARNGGSDPSVALGNQKVVRIGAGDADGDGDADLYLSHQAARTLIPFRNAAGDSATAACFSEPEGAIILGIPGETATTNFATPLVANLGDGAGDYTVFFVQSGGCAFLRALGMLFLPDDEQGTYLAVVAHPVFEEYKAQFSNCTSPYAPLTNARVTLTVQNGPDAQNPAWPSSVTSATHLELIVWREVAATPAYPAQNSFDHAVYSLPNTMQPGDSYNITFDLQESVCNPIQAGCDSFSTRYYIELRPVTYSGGAITAAWRTYVGGLTGDFFGSNGSFDYLIGLDGAWTDTIPWTKCPPNTGSTVGGLAPQTRVPPFDPGPPIVSNTISQRTAVLL